MIIDVQFPSDALYALSTNLFHLTNGAIGRAKSQMLSNAILFRVGVMRCHCDEKEAKRGDDDDCSDGDDPRIVDA